VEKIGRKGSDKKDHVLRITVGKENNLSEKLGETINW